MNHQFHKSVLMRVFRILSFAFSLAIMTPRSAFADGLLSSYRIAGEIRTAATSSSLAYKTPTTGPLPKECAAVKDEANTMRCVNDLREGSSSPYGFSIQKVFKRQGLFYGDYSLGLSFFSLDASTHIEPQELNPQPLQKSRIHLYGLEPKAFIVFGITPARILPDVLLSLGIGEHASTGNLKIDQFRKDVTVTSGLTFFQLELVWWRFGDGGALASYLSREANNREQTFKGRIEAYTDVSLLPSSTSFGLIKFVVPFGF